MQVVINTDHNISLAELSLEYFDSRLTQVEFTSPTAAPVAAPAATSTAGSRRAPRA